MISPIGNDKISTRQSLKSSALSFKSNLYKSIDKNSGDYIKYVYRQIRSACTKPVEINVETGRMMDIAQSSEPFIFIMNHTLQQGKDIYNAEFFNALLYREYIYNNKAQSCPRSKILASNKILDSIPEQSEEYKWMGVVPVKASFIKHKKDNYNSNVIKNLVQELISGKINLFLFPEGVLAQLAFLPMKYKFQPGVSAIIKKVLEIKDKIKVIPLGMAHQKDGSSIHIGKPVEFSKDGDKYFVDRGNADSTYFDKDLTKLYADKEKMVLTNDGIPVGEKEVVPYISGVLVKNLECCVKESEEDLKKSSSEVFEI